ncbi:5-(carboxyamino)imidazole ribonucleotide synthase [Lichenicola cladoniae]|uniref:N5-carboxyaminoimidazole ribonucleotide synthase n=2 Tax=Lichenicola cladoniae TaxID=1484109 RepID=A0A6M8HW71_9PROT|nr:5-(carboxyamino)imidazole ribonucleotide synthase [Lichenicola cladoniae]NPD67352.1 5-(carboxyamino)imidazole ribonucleotide synthase [Acetobacteraceae bacterium]QKE92496.1 5-(carboxyamino)imidazole ribonucleotide synthase [Lichenicola cladoniae]
MGHELALPPGSVIGIIGGGQLGRMSAMAAARLGYRTHILTTEPDGPAAQVATGATIGAHDDPDVLRRFAAAVDVITFEFENISADGLELLSALKPVRPDGSILRISQDRLAEKRFLADAGIPLAPWHTVDTRTSLDDAATALGLPFVLKTTRLGYDGKGQRVIRERNELDAAFAALDPHPLVAEGFVDFACELSVMVARGLDGVVRTYDAVQNHHRHHILDLTLAPAPVTPDIAQEAQALAVRIAEALGLVGLLGVEMFVAADGTLLVNEIAPRPHNSGHWTMDACLVSQFEMHVRAVAGLPLPPATRHSDALMKNLVGPADMALWPLVLATNGLLPHLYGKQEARAGRKMGHVNRLFPKGGLPGAFGIQAALGPLAAAGTAEPDA